MKKNQEAHVGGDIQEGVVFTNLCVANTPDVHALCLHPHTQLCMQSVEHTINMSQVIIVYLHDTLIYMVQYMYTQDMINFLLGH